MPTLKDIVIFLAGAAFFHTISHFMLPYFITFPIDMKVMTLTAGGNVWVIVLSAAITILLLWFAKYLGKK